MATWPIAQRGAELEESFAQMAAKDRVNRWGIQLKQKLEAEKLAKKSKVDKKA